MSSAFVEGMVVARGFVEEAGGGPAWSFSAGGRDGLSVSSIAWTRELEICSCGGRECDEVGAVPLVALGGAGGGARPATKGRGGAGRVACGRA